MPAAVRSDGLGMEVARTCPDDKDELMSRKNDARRSTRISLQIPVVVTSLDSARDFYEECKTAFVNAHGCAIIVRERLPDETPVMLKLLSNKGPRCACRRAS